MVSESLRKASSPQLGTEQTVSSETALPHTLSHSFTQALVFCSVYVWFVCKFSRLGWSCKLTLSFGCVKRFFLRWACFLGFGFRIGSIKQKNALLLSCRGGTALAQPMEDLLDLSEELKAGEGGEKGVEASLFQHQG